MPTACHQARKQGVLGSPAIKVEGLRIELAGKSFHLLLIDDVGSARKALPDVEIIEIEPVIVAEYLHGRCLRSQQALKCPSSFHYSENLLIEIQADLLQKRGSA